VASQLVASRVVLNSSSSSSSSSSSLVSCWKIEWNWTGKWSTFIVPFLSLLPRVEAGFNTSTVIPASHKRQRKGNRVSLR
jgi:hypothetical protein